MPTSFLQKTYDMLSNNSLSSIVSWSSDGTEFIIFSMNEFSEKVLPMYFKHSNFASFIRQLNMYDFHKLRSGTQEHIYQHSLFLRGRSDLLKEIKRKTSDSTWPIIQKSSQKSNIEPMINKLIQIHKKNINYESQIQSLEEKVINLVTQNKLLADQLWENKNFIKKIESALMNFARYLKNHGKFEELYISRPMFENILSITESPHELLKKKQKIDDDYIPQSPLVFSDFDEDAAFGYTDKRSSFSEVDLNPEMTFDCEKIEFLLDQ
ncbi:hypothetical protein SteCoe_31949 [Stentor coeruleus]|uniref:HSF-type DNA-binding domain-containing protein n=1 Tax=Stentor coeruleus TaxID=5963 RepID=A0A1R2B015_9CILI|nr:hypothetical protein SteCoe_31949 [Stentor coeruleus]